MYTHIYIHVRQTREDILHDLIYLQNLKKNQLKQDDYQELG